jgi:hypothetical protein
VAPLADFDALVDFEALDDGPVVALVELVTAGDVPAGALGDVDADAVFVVPPPEPPHPASATAPTTIASIDAMAIERGPPPRRSKSPAGASTPDLIASNISQP